LRTGYIGKVADDREGKLLLKDFKKEGVNTEGVAVAKTGRSGVVTGYVDREGERALYVDPGVNDSLEFGEISIEYASRAKLLHLTSFVGEKPFEAQKRLVNQLPDIEVSFDPGEIYTLKGLAVLKPLNERSLVVFPNENEVKMLTGEGYEKGSRVLLREGARVVAVKLGGKGCYITNGRESHLIEPCRVEVVDTTGAGDAFCAGFLYGLMKKKDLYECGKLGNLVASKCIGRVGARTGLPKAHEIKGF